MASSATTEAECLECGETVELEKVVDIWKGECSSCGASVFKLEGEEG